MPNEGVTSGVIELRNVSKKYALYAHPSDRFKELLTFNRRRYHREHWALRDVTFAAERGETLCIVGENGSGKSTLLEVIAGILPQSGGTVAAGGRISALLELGTGFNPEFTGRENIYLNAAVLGFSRQEIAKKLDDILRFAEIGSYIDQPVRTYSSGMVLRLGFSVAVHVNPDILIVDEALAVGDIYFRQRCMRRIHEMKAKGVTIVFVTHDISDVKALGDRALWLAGGRMVQLGSASEVAAAYLAALVAKDSRSQSKRPDALQEPQRRSEPAEVIRWMPRVPKRHGSGRAEVLGILLTDERGTPMTEVQLPARAVIRISVRAREEIRSPIVGFHLRTHDGVDFSGTNTAREEAPIPPMTPGEIHTVDFHVRLPELAPTEFTLTPAIADGTLLEFELCDLVEDALTIQVADGGLPVCGYMHIPCASVVVHQASSAVPAGPR